MEKGSGEAEGADTSRHRGHLVWHLVVPPCSQHLVTHLHIASAHVRYCASLACRLAMSTLP